MLGIISIVAVVVYLRSRSLYTGIFASVFSISTIAGPLIGSFHSTRNLEMDLLQKVACKGFVIAAFMFTGSSTHRFAKWRRTTFWPR
jgi:hypothetical protein